MILKSTGKVKIFQEENRFGRSSSAPRAGLIIFRKSQQSKKIQSVKNPIF